ERASDNVLESSKNWLKSEVSSEGGRLLLLEQSPDSLGSELKSSPPQTAKVLAPPGDPSITASRFSSRMESVYGKNVGRLVGPRRSDRYRRHCRDGCLASFRHRPHRP